MIRTRHAKMALTSITGLSLLAGSANAALVGHWKFDGDLTDSVGSLDAAAVGDATVGTTDGQIGGAISFDGNGDAATIASSVITGTEFSISFWEFAPITATNAKGYFLSAGASGFQDIFLQRFNATTYDGSVSNNGSLAGTTVNAGSWHHSLVTHTNTGGAVGEAKWYVDGALIGTQVTDDWTSLSTTLYLGNRSDLVRSFEGKLDDLQIYDETLDLADAAFLNSNPGSVVGIPEPTTTALLGLGGLALILRRRK